MYRTFFIALTRVYLYSGGHSILDVSPLSLSLSLSFLFSLRHSGSLCHDDLFSMWLYDGLMVCIYWWCSWFNAVVGAFVLPIFQIMCKCNCWWVRWIFFSRCVLASLFHVSLLYYSHFTFHGPSSLIRMKQTGRLIFDCGPKWFIDNDSCYIIIITIVIIVFETAEGKATTFSHLLHMENWMIRPFKVKHLPPRCYLNDPFSFCMTFFWLFPSF